MLRHIEAESQYTKALSVLKVRDSGFNPAIHQVSFGNTVIRIDVPLPPVTNATRGLATTLFCVAMSTSRKREHLTWP
jgi:circadian clock protein KaiC